MSGGTTRRVTHWPATSSITISEGSEIPSPRDVISETITPITKMLIVAIAKISTLPQ
jgi:hypothetical protein